MFDLPIPPRIEQSRIAARSICNKFGAPRVTRNSADVLAGIFYAIRPPRLFSRRSNIFLFLSSSLPSITDTMPSPGNVSPSWEIKQYFTLHRTKLLDSPPPKAASLS
jgi:hypothetical protein